MTGKIKLPALQIFMTAVDTVELQIFLRLKTNVAKEINWPIGCLPLLISRTTTDSPPMRILLETLIPPSQSSVTLASQVLRSLIAAYCRLAVNVDFFGTFCQIFR